MFKDYSTRFLLFVIDFLVILLSIFLAFEVRDLFSDKILSFSQSFPLSVYLTFWPLYFTPLLIFFYEGIYSHRFDFWHESRLVVKGLFLTLIIILAYLALTKSIEDYSRIVITLSFFLMMLLVPLVKNISKKVLFKIGLWRRSAVVYGKDSFFEREIFGNSYLGYVKSDKEAAYTVFIHSKDREVNELQQRINEEIIHNHEVIFVPLVSQYDLTHSQIYELSNTRTNLIVLNNRLKSRYRLLFKKVTDSLLFILVFPVLLPLLGIITVMLKRDDPKGRVIFKQKRMGKNQRTFTCYKFRTMAENGDALLKAYLKEHPEEIANYAKYHKYTNDPRITKMGHFLRRTSLDELPQILNIFRREMSFIGPRPYMLQEKEKIGKDLETILTVKPGITGLWQVSGRSDVDFESRIELDVWYIKNWNLWMDLVILVKTVKAVLLRQGAN